MNTKVLMNKAIRFQSVRLNDGDDSRIVPTQEAQDLADSRGLDLVVIAEKAEPPVVKIMDYGKFKYAQEKAEKERRKKQRASVVEVKEIQLRPVTDMHDIEIKAKRARGFLDDGDKVKIVVKFKGRELSHKEMGRNVIDTFCNSVGDYKMDTPPNVDGRQMFVILSPVK